MLIYFTINFAFLKIFFLISLFWFSSKMTVKKYIFKFGFIFKIFFFLYATNFFYVWKFEIDNEDINMYLLHVTPDLLKPNNETSQHFSVFEACWLIINGYGWMTGLVMCEGMNSEACWCMARVQYILKHLYSSYI